MRALKQTFVTEILKVYSVTTQAHEGIETITCRLTPKMVAVTTQAHEGIETLHPDTSVLLYKVTTQAHEGIETQAVRSATCRLG